jgi:hypothetical protein
MIRLQFCPSSHHDFVDASMYWEDNILRSLAVVRLRYGIETDQWWGLGDLWCSHHYDPQACAGLALATHLLEVRLAESTCLHALMSRPLPVLASVARVPVRQVQRWLCRDLCAVAIQRKEWPLALTDDAL